MPNVICHYGIKGMKWHKLKSVKPDDPKGMDNPREEKMYKWEKWLYDYMQSPFHHYDEHPNYTGREFRDGQPSRSKDESINQPRLHLDRAPRPHITPPRPIVKEHGINLPMKNRMSSATKKKVDGFIQGILNKTINSLKGG